jgi:hypothetical protein
VSDNPFDKFDINKYLRKPLGRVVPFPRLRIDRPSDLVALAQAYKGRGDMVSCFGCLYLLTALRHPPDDDMPAAVQLSPIPPEWVELKEVIGHGLASHFNDPESAIPDWA